jgi:hypothetical protein
MQSLWYYISLTPQFLQHRFEIENKDGSEEVITSTLCEYGAPFGSSGHSAMAKLVGIPCAVGKSSFLQFYNSAALRVEGVPFGSQLWPLSLHFWNLCLGRG